MAGYIGANTVVTQVDGYTRDEAQRAFFPFLPGMFFHIGRDRGLSPSFPFVCLDGIEDYADYDAAQVPDLVEELRLWKAEVIYRDGTDTKTTDDSWSVTVASGVVTFPDTTSGNAIVKAIVEEAAAVGRNHGTANDYTNLGKVLTLDGVEYVVSDGDDAARTLTVTSPPSDGAYTAIVYPHRVAGDATKVRLFETAGMSLAAPGDPDGLFVTGVRRRGYFQGHYPSIRSYDTSHTNQIYNDGFAQGYVGGGGLRDQSASIDNRGFTTASYNSDGANGTPRVGPETHGPRVFARMMMFVGRCLYA